MATEFRSWLNTHETGDGTARRGQRNAVAEVRPSLCYVLDEEAGGSDLLIGTLRGSGVESTVFERAPALIEAIDSCNPDIVFVNVAAETNDAIDAIFSLGERRFNGPVQLMGSDTAQVIETVKRMGERHSLNMLPALHKPFAASALRRIIETQNLGWPARAQINIPLAVALANGWIDFWYQPKIDLRRKQIAGVETFARVRHPQLGMLPPGTFMPGADEASLTELTHQAMVAALRAAANFSQLGITLKFAVNISISALATLPIAEIVRQCSPKRANWPGLIFDVTEEQIKGDLPLVKEISQELAQSNIRLAIDDFGSGRIPLAKLHELSFAELKLDRNFVHDCGSNKANAAVCKMVVDIAHSFGGIAVAIGVEQANDVRALRAMGCDLGQGFLFGQPMPEENLVSLLRQRATVAKRHSSGRRMAAQM